MLNCIRGQIRLETDTKEINWREADQETAKITLFSKNLESPHSIIYRLETGGF